MLGKKPSTSLLVVWSQSPEPTLEGWMDVKELGKNRGRGTGRERRKYNAGGQSMRIIFLKTSLEGGQRMGGKDSDRKGGHKGPPAWDMIWGSLPKRRRTCSSIEAGEWNEQKRLQGTWSNKDQGKS